MWSDQLEPTECPVCHTKYEAFELANEKGVDFEGAFFLAKSSYTCKNCGAKLNVEIDWQWRLVQEK
jgi:transposase-like protein